MEDDSACACSHRLVVDRIQPRCVLKTAAARAGPVGKEGFFAPQGRAGEWMKADIDDAPERVIRKRHNRGALYSVSCLVIGSIAVTGASQLISRAPSVDSAYERSMSTAAGQGKLIRVSEVPQRQDIEPSQLQTSSDIAPPTNSARQTVFNDQNFTPRGADNVISLHAGSAPSPRKESPKQVQLTIVRQSPSMKERVCWPYRQGSIESRNCRAWIGLRHRD